MCYSESEAFGSCYRLACQSSYYEYYPIQWRVWLPRLLAQRRAGYYCVYILTYLWIYSTHLPRFPEGEDLLVCILMVAFPIELTLSISVMPMKPIFVKRYMFVSHLSSKFHTSLSQAVFGVKGISPLCELQHFDIIQGNPIDYMHCVLLGVVRKIFTLWFDSSNHSKEWYVICE